MTGQQLSLDSPVFEHVVKWLKNCPVKLEGEEREELLELVRTTFQTSQDELTKRIFDAPIERYTIVEDTTDPAELERELWELLPKAGFFWEYANYTRNIEGPLAYHFFSSLVAVGATINRRCYLPMGSFNLYPPLGVIILGPSGLRKTTAADIAVNLIQLIGLTKVYSEKLTPEALVEGMSSTAQGIVYAPELAVLLNKQKFNEGLVPLLTRFMDCPDTWQSETVSRGARPLTNVAISLLMCSTPDWFVENTPKDTFGGGFIARCLLVMQEDSPRSFPIPRPLSQNAMKTLAGNLSKIHQMEGRMSLAPGVEDFYGNWYNEHKRITKGDSHNLLVTYYQRKPLHILRVAISLHLADHRSTMLCMECVERAIKIVDWNEKFLPSLLKEMFRTEEGSEQRYVLQLIRSNGGVMDHSVLVRKVQYKMGAAKLWTILRTLKEAKQLEEKTNPVHAWVVR